MVSHNHAGDKYHNDDIHNYLLYADNCIIGGCMHIYPEVLHLLCRWHVDRYVNILYTGLNKP